VTAPYLVISVGLNIGQYKGQIKLLFSKNGSVQNKVWIGKRAEAQREKTEKN
jgi:hypothetical protein